MSDHDREEEDAFRALMAAAGVTPLSRETGRSPRPRKAPQSARTPPAPPPATPPATSPRPAPTEAALDRAALNEARAELAQLREALAAVQRERDALDAQRRSLQRKLSERAAPAPPRGHPLAELLSKRGLPPEAHPEALKLLLAEHPRALLAALSLSPTEPLTQLLNQRLALSCGVGACAHLDGAAALRVPPERCEICGGSDAKRAFHDFANACRDHGLRKVVIVGGSAAYRKVLKGLAAPRRSALRVELFPGQTKPREKKIRDLARGADLLIIWCASILDHATTEAFIATGAPNLTLPHRGITTMLRAAAESIRGGRGRTRGLG